MGNETYLLPLPNSTLEDLMAKDQIGVNFDGYTYQICPEVLQVKSNYFYFVIPEATPITASRGGIVTRLESNRRTDGLSHRKSHSTNLVRISHGDGTFATYFHVFPTIALGAKLEDGQQLGMSGGGLKEYSNHLHLLFKKEYDLVLFKLSRCYSVQLSYAPEFTPKTLL